MMMLDVTWPKWLPESMEDEFTIPSISHLFCLHGNVDNTVKFGYQLGTDHDSLRPHLKQLLYVF